MISTTGVVFANNILAATVSLGAVPPMHTPSKHFPSYYTGWTILLKTFTNSCVQSHKPFLTLKF